MEANEVVVSSIPIYNVNLFEAMFKRLSIRLTLIGSILVNDGSPDRSERDLGRSARIRSLKNEDICCSGIQELASDW